MKGKLTPEIISLIHHVELNESGWWKKAVGQFVKGALWKTEKPQTLAGLLAALKHEVGISLTDDVLVNQLDILMCQRAVIKIPNQSYKLTEQARNDLNAIHEIAANEQEAVLTQVMVLVVSTVISGAGIRII